MTNTLSVRTNVLSLGTLLAVFSMLSLGVGASLAHAAVTSQMDIGSTGSQVTELQTYLATNVNIYPEGRVTGYFGVLTEAAVKRFQVAQGIVSSGSPATTGYGRVGPATLARLAVLMGTGGVVTGDTVPVLYNITSQNTSTTVTITWNTNEPTQGQVYWSTSQIVADEATGPRQQPYVSGTLALDAGGLQTSHTVTVSNLQPNTNYYYMVRSVDSTGNMSMIWPPNSFHTSN